MFLWWIILLESQVRGGRDVESDRRGGRKGKETLKQRSLSDFLVPNHHQLGSKQRNRATCIFDKVNDILDDLLGRLLSDLQWKGGQFDGVFWQQFNMRVDPICCNFLNYVDSLKPNKEQ